MDLKLTTIFQTYKLYIYGAIIAAVLGAVFYGAWSWRGTIAEVEQDKAVKSAVTDAVQQIEVRLQEERANRSYFQGIAEGILADLGKKLDGIRSGQTEVKVAVSKGLARDPKFYSQPIPQPERDAWLKARKLASQPASSASAPSP